MAERNDERPFEEQGWKDYSELADQYKDAVGKLADGKPLGTALDALVPVVAVMIMQLPPQNREMEVERFVEALRSVMKMVDQLVSTKLH